MATGEPGKAAASDNLFSPVHPRPDATGAERTGFLALSRTAEWVRRDEDIRRSRRAGFAGHLTKPIDLRRRETMSRQVAS